MERTSTWNRDEIEDEGKNKVEKLWKELKEVVQEAMVKKRIKKKRKELGYRDWWDRSCTRKKRETKRLCRRWREGKVDKDKYIEAKGDLKNLLKKKQREKREEEELELKNIRREAEVWRYINRKRERKVWIENNIGKEDWCDYFMELLEGSKEEVKIPTRSYSGEEQTDDTVSEEEIGKALYRLKLGKAVGIDGIPTEAWKYSGEERESFYNRNGWGIAEKEVEGEIGYNIEKELIERERDVQRQWEDAKIRDARYNKKYKEIEAEGKGPRYLKKVNLQELQALVKLRCGNLEEVNKFWKREKEDRKMLCVFCGEGKDDLEHYVKFCEKVRGGWFQELGENSDEIIKILRDENLDEKKGKILRRLWKEKEKEKENANKKRGVD
ncbi:hypothetical protein ALC62_13072 [Cyphomyrmex costatus]|uniref:Uncharacterized protein n=1 Tax=Cyphomyrmex costatus TaxID=456900 RepID=A0A151IAG4_9HYME|nr:hypothetical protein ALC62_13072 [Cyphomyrmex costatus]